VLLLENVTGLTFNGKDEAVHLINRRLREINRRSRTAYKAHVITLNAADYGVAQLRERVFILASIDGRDFELPAPTHGEGSMNPYLTAWDAIGHLDHETWPTELNATGRWAALLPSIPEGHNYLWHTPRNAAKGGEPLFGWRTRFWSFLLKLAKDRPSWTIQADPGPATGPFHWRSRLLSVEEICRLQTFPRDYVIVGDRRSARRQVGNAVPAAIGEFLGWEIRRQLLGERVRGRQTLLPTRRVGRPPAEPATTVAEEYRLLRANHSEHPGTGEGPAARRRRSAAASRKATRRE
jgi:DNA (cytosine-5)-methyltransferase 1